MPGAAPYGFHENKERPGACADCGNSPVNHLEAYVTQTVAVWASGTSPDGRERPIRRFVERVGGRIFDSIVPHVLAFMVRLPGVTLAHDPEHAASYRSQVIWEEAARRGIRMEQLVFFGLRSDIYRAFLRGRWHYFQSLPIPPERASGSYEWMDDKHVLKRFLRAEGIPVPESHAVRTIDEAQAARAHLGRVVVKPRIGTRGRHTTVNVGTEKELRQAFRSAQQLCAYISIETYLEGSVCRATVVGGVLAGFFQADPPRVTGDGVSTIEQLVAAANARKPERVADIVITPHHEEFLSRAGLARSSVLPAGKTIALSHRGGRVFGGSTRELLGREHPRLREYVERAAKRIGAPVIGFDLIIGDPELDPDAQTWGIIEANSLPFIDLHYLPLAGEPSNVAARVWDLWG